MQEHIEDILKDLYALDPTLLPRDQDVRAIVHALMAADPKASPDAAFVRKLRTRLRENTSLGAETPYFAWDLWFLRLAPLGAIALIILILIPSMSPVEDGENVVPPTDMFMIESADTGSRKQAPVSDAADSSLMQMTMDAGDSIVVSSQRPGDLVIIESVALTDPGFVAIHTDANGDFGKVIGKSTLLYGGLSAFVEIPLSMVSKDGATLYAALYRDDGDGTFNLVTDQPVLDPLLGDPMYSLFVVSQESEPGIHQ